MPASYSLDLRQRVVDAVDAGEGTRKQVARRFSVSLGWVEKLLRQRRQRGHIAPLGHGGGAPRSLDEPAVEKVQAAVAAQPDITLQELRLRLHRQARVRVSVSSLWRLLATLDLPRKKRPSQRGRPTRPNAGPSVSA
jgi:transposase